MIEVVFGYYGCILCNFIRWFDRGFIYCENLLFFCINLLRLYIKILLSIRKCIENSECFFLKRKKKLFFIVRLMNFEVFCMEWSWFGLIFV